MPEDPGVPKWRRRAIAGLMLLTLAILAGVAAFTYLAYQRAASDQMVERDRHVAYLSAARLKDEMTKYSDILSSVARTPELYRYDSGTRRAALQRAHFRLAAFDGGVILLDTFGKVAAAEPERPEIMGADWSDRTFFRALLASNSTYFSDTTHDGPAGSATVVISVPLTGDNNEFLGVLAGMFRLGGSTGSAFYASIVRLRLEQSGDTYVLDGNGQVLYDSRFGRIGQNWAFETVPGYREGRGAVRIRDPEGLDVIAVYAPVPGTRWMLVSEDDWTAAMEPVRGYARLLLAVIAPAVVLPTIGALLLLRKGKTESPQQAHDAQEAWAANLLRQRLIPRQAPMLPGWSIAVHYQSADKAGGDFHDFRLTSDGQLMLAVGDVALTGIPAAYVMSTARATFHSAARRALSPAEALDYSNSLICPEVLRDNCVTSLYAVLDPVAGRLTFASAGFNDPVYRAKGEIRKLGAPGRIPGLPLGSAPDTHYEQAEVTLGPGEAVVVYSNGLLGTRNAAGEEFGLSRLEALLISHDGDAPSIIEAVRSGLEEFAGRRCVPQDDVTVLVLERSPLSPAAPGEPDGNGV